MNPIIQRLTRKSESRNAWGYKGVTAKGNNNTPVFDLTGCLYLPLWPNVQQFDLHGNNLHEGTRFVLGMKDYL